MVDRNVALQRVLHYKTMRDRASITRPGTPVETETGGQRPGTPATTGPYRARLTPLSAEQQVATGAVGLGAKWQLALPAHTDVLAGDTVTVSGDSPGPWSKTVEVVGVDGPHSQEVERLCQCKE